MTAVAYFDEVGTVILDKIYTYNEYVILL